MFDDHFTDSKYCNLLEKDGGVEVLKSFLTEERPVDSQLPLSVKWLAVITLFQYYLYKNFKNIKGLEKSSKIECFRDVNIRYVQDFFSYFKFSQLADEFLPKNVLKVNVTRRIGLPFKKAFKLLNSNRFVNNGDNSNDGSGNESIESAKTDASEESRHEAIMNDNDSDDDDDSSIEGGDFLYPDAPGEEDVMEMEEFDDYDDMDETD